MLLQGNLGRQYCEEDQTECEERQHDLIVKRNLWALTCFPSCTLTASVF